MHAEAIAVANPSTEMPVRRNTTHKCRIWVKDFVNRDIFTSILIALCPAQRIPSPVYIVLRTSQTYHSAVRSQNSLRTFARWCTSSPPHPAVAHFPVYPCRWNRRDMYRWEHRRSCCPHTPPHAASRQPISSHTHLSSIGAYTRQCFQLQTFHVLTIPYLLFICVKKLNYVTLQHPTLNRCSLTPHDDEMPFVLLLTKQIHIAKLTYCPNNNKVMNLYTPLRCPWS